jgi:hypothetical protein
MRSAAAPKRDDGQRSVQGPPRAHVHRNSNKAQHERPQKTSTGNTPRTVPGLSFVPLPRNDRSRSVNPYAKPPPADLLPLNRVRPRAFE